MNRRAVKGCRFFYCYNPEPIKTLFICFFVRFLLILLHQLIEINKQLPC
jgi:hypothetical protein